MNEVNHTSEFSQPSRGGVQSSQSARELARDYAQVFLGTDAGRRVYADLQQKFGLGRLCFVPGERGRPDYLVAAIVDGERRVMLEIQNALRLGCAGTALVEEFRKTL